MSSLAGIFRILWEDIKLSDGGERGIRTLGTVARTRDFQSRTFGHSVTFPGLNWVFSETLRAFEYLQCALILQVLMNSANEV